MNRIAIVPLALLLAACAGESSGPSAKAPAAPAPAATAMTGTVPGDRLPAFTAKVRRTGSPAEEAFDLAAAKGTTVLVVMSTQCPWCAEAVEPLKRVESTFQSRGVEFVYVYPMKAEPDEEKIAWHAANGFKAGQVLDANAAVARALKADKTPTAYLVDARGVLRYRGSVVAGAPGGGPAAHPLADAIDEVLAGKAVSVTAAEPAG
jgi:glutaredoxin